MKKEKYCGKMKIMKVDKKIRMGNLSQTVVKHLCYKKGWNDIKPKNPITLIIGSFNPYIPTNKFLPDYYYGPIIILIF
jgi:hypothetical protein